MSNRQTIIGVLTKLVVATIEDLAGETGWPERKVRDTIGDMKTHGMIKAERDEVTGKAAYRLVSEAQQKAAAAKPVDIDVPVIRKTRTTAPGQSNGNESAKATESEADFMRREIKNLQSANTGLAVESDTFKKIATERQEQIDQLQEQLKQTAGSLAIASGALSAAERDRDDLRQKAKQYQDTVSDYLLKQLDEPAVDVKDVATGYIVRVPGKKPRLCLKPDSARNAALSSARAHGRADVFALVPVGKAVRGAEWREAA